jgi:hypothetical protein
MPIGVRDSWQALAVSGISERLFGRILFIAILRQNSKQNGSKPLSSESLRSFLRFWVLIRADAAEPFLSVAPNGHLCGEWHTSWSRHLDVEFAQEEMAYFGLFHGKEEIEGYSNISDLAKMIQSRPKNPFRWTVNRD